MMLTRHEADRVWERMVEAEVRSFYFADLASRYTTRKQIITGITFFLSSGAAATLVGKLPAWLPLSLSIIVAIVTAYSIAIGLDSRIKTLTELHYRWNHLSADYERLWNHWQEDDAEQVLEDLLRRAREASETGTEMPYDSKLVEKWQKMVYSRFQRPATV
jgi:hypothetical protein